MSSTVSHWDRMSSTVSHWDIPVMSQSSTVSHWDRMSSTVSHWDRMSSTVSHWDRMSSTVRKSLGHVKHVFLSDDKMANVSLDVHIFVAQNLKILFPILICTLLNFLIRKKGVKNWIS